MSSLVEHVTFGGNGIQSFHAIVGVTCSPSVAHLIDYAVATARIDYVAYGRPVAEKHVLDVIQEWVDARLIVRDARGRWEMVP